MSTEDPDEQRATLRESWEAGAPGWAASADRIRAFTMPLSSWMIENAALQPGMTVVELAAGPGDTGFFAAELVAPGGTLISSDGADAMVQVARARAERLGITNVEFRRLELEWIDLETASVDVVLCRWGVMLTVDPAAALQEMRRVLKPIGKAVLAVWDTAEVNPWATIPTAVLIERGLAPPPDPDAPGMFVLAAPGRLQEMLEDAGFADVRVEAVDLPRMYADVEEYATELETLSGLFRRAIAGADEDERAAVIAAIAERVEPFREDAGGFTLPGRSLAAVATA